MKSGANAENGLASGYTGVIQDHRPCYHSTEHTRLPIQLRGDLWYRKTSVPALSCGVVCVILV